MSMIHTFEASNLGKAPFRVIGLYSFPSKSLAEHNPDAYQRQLNEMPRDVACGSCAYCGMGLTHNYIIKSADDKKFVVGCDCVEKTGDKGMVDQIKLIERENRAEARRLAQEADAKARLDAERAANGGLTVHEVYMAKKQAVLALRAPVEAQIVESITPIINALHRANGDFAKDMKAYLEVCHFEALSGRMVSIILDIAAKEVGRRGSKAYNARYDELAALLEKNMEIYKGLPALP